MARFNAGTAKFAARQVSRPRPTIRRKSRSRAADRPEGLDYPGATVAPPALRVNDADMHRREVLKPGSPDPTGGRAVRVKAAHDAGR